MNWYIIYEASSPNFEKISHVKMKGAQWKQTEGRDEMPYDYLPGWEYGNHFKQTAVVNNKGLTKFLFDSGLMFEDIETMGAITEYGHLPAFSFTDGGNEQYIASAYVSPMVDREWPEEIFNKAWERWKKIFKENY